MFKRRCPSCNEKSISLIAINYKCDNCKKKFVIESKYFLFDALILNTIKYIIYLFLIFFIPTFLGINFFISFFIILILGVLIEEKLEQYIPLIELKEEKNPKLSKFIIFAICASILFFTFYTLYEMKYKNDQKEITNINQISYKKTLY